MSDTTKIEWADKTFNPWIGCTKVSPGCAHCYAEQTTRARVLRGQGHETWGKGAKRSRTSLNSWKQPMKWDRDVARDRARFELQDAQNGHPGLTRNARVFPSLCDWLDDEVPIDWLADFLRLIYETPHLDWLLLTKRPQNFRTRMEEIAFRVESQFDSDVLKKRGDVPFMRFRDWLNYWCNPGLKRNSAPTNVWLGTSVEDQKRADERIPELVKIPARVRFLSVEPMLEGINFPTNCLVTNPGDPSCCTVGIDGCFCGNIAWVIFGGESGPKARPCNVGWIRAGVEQCQAAGVACFVKQLGGNVVSRNDAGYNGESPSECPMATDMKDLDPRTWQGAPVRVLLKHKKGGDMAEWPEDLRVRQFPGVNT